MSHNSNLFKEWVKDKDWLHSHFCRIVNTLLQEMPKEYTILMPYAPHKLISDGAEALLLYLQWYRETQDIRSAKPILLAVQSYFDFMELNHIWYEFSIALSFAFSTAARDHETSFLLRTMISNFLYGPKCHIVSLVFVLKKEIIDDIEGSVWLFRTATHFDAIGVAAIGERGVNLKRPMPTTFAGLAWPYKAIEPFFNDIFMSMSGSNEDLSDVKLRNELLPKIYIYTRQLFCPIIERFSIETEYNIITPLFRRVPALNTIYDTGAANLLHMPLLMLSGPNTASLISKGPQHKQIMDPSSIRAFFLMLMPPLFIEELVNRIEVFLDKTDLCKPITIGNFCNDPLVQIFIKEYVALSAQKKDSNNNSIDREPLYISKLDDELMFTHAAHHFLIIFG